MIYRTSINMKRYKKYHFEKSDVEKIILYNQNNETNEIEYNFK